MENISKVYEKLLSLKSTKLILDDGRGRKLYDVSVSPAFRTKYFKYSLPQRTDGFELKTKSDITGNAYDRGWVLIDNRQQLKDRQPNPKNRNNKGVTMATKKFSPAQLAAQKLFAERARSGTLKKGKRKAVKRRANPSTNRALAIYLDAIAVGETYSESKLIEALEHPALSASDKVVIRAAIKGASYSHTALQDVAIKIRNYVNGRKTNPDKAKPRAYVKRVSQATGAPPSKRLVTRRKKALTAPAGYFPNPKTSAMMTGYQVICMHPKKHVVGIFKTIAEAKQVATAMANAKGVAYAVKTVKVHKTHFAV